MKPVMILITAALAIMLTTVGCETKEGVTVAKKQPAATCPVCGQGMKGLAYCAKCNAVATTKPGTVYCQMCKKDFKAGTYCAKCNRFMFDKSVKLSDGRKSVMGTYDSRLKLYAGLTDVGYCPKCKKPYPKATGRLCCGKKKK